VAVEGCTGWRYVVEEIEAAGFVSANGLVVSVEHRAPALVADGGEPVGGADNVGEQQGGEHPSVMGGDAGAGQEFFDLVDDDGTHRRT